jgi:hypothetical protein
MNNVKSLKEIVKQLRSCGYTCEAGPLENNADFQMLERIAGVEPERTLDSAFESARTALIGAGEVIRNNLEGNPFIKSFRVRSPQEIRDDIIEQAKRDVAEIVERGIDVKAKGGSEGNETYRDSFYEVNFNVNKEKRTVVSLIKGATGDGRVFGVRHRGIAKCAPDDCFNVHIGKAIALRRALGLEVPPEYLNAPQPTEVRVGDVVLFDDDDEIPHVVDYDQAPFVSEPIHNIHLSYAQEAPHTIIDDSRE